MKLRTKRWLDAACVLAALILLAVVVELTLEARKRDLRGARSDVVNLAVALELYVRSTVSSIDHSLLAARYALRLANLRLDQDIARGNALLADAVQRLEQPVQMRVLDRRGQLVYSSDGSRIGGNAADRDYFRAHADVADDAGLFISDLLTSRINGRASVVFSRRLVDADGTFDGVILVGAPVSVFEADFARLAIGPRGVVMLADDDGTLFARRPAIPERVGLPVRPAARAALASLGKDRGAVELESRDDDDGVGRLYGFRRIGQTHLVVGVAQSLPDKLATWRLQALIVLPLTLGLAAGVVLLFFTVTGNLVRTTRLARELAASVAAERASNAAKTRFLASMSHELMTPLNGICGALSLWLMDERDDGRRALGEAALASAGRLTRTLQDSLAFVDASAAPGTLPLTALDLRAWLPTLDTAFAELADASACRLQRPDDDGQALPVRSEPAFLDDIVRRLLQAALQVARACAAQRPGVIAVRIEPAVQGCRDIAIEVAVVADAAQRLEAALLPFAPSSLTESDGLQGMGLGLEVARLRARQIDARLHAEIADGVLRLVLTLPV